MVPGLNLKQSEEIEGTKATVLDNNRTMEAFAKVLRELVQDIHVTRGSAPGEITIQLCGKLRALLADTTPKIRVGGVMVAREGFEPPTKGL